MGAANTSTMDLSDFNQWPLIFVLLGCFLLYRFIKSNKQ